MTTIRVGRCLAALAFVAASALTVDAQEARRYKDIPYAVMGPTRVALDIYTPAGVTAAPLVVWVHGGAWRQGTKAGPPMEFVENGFALASVDFRQSTDARFPTMIYDIKAAIRFLRANAKKYSYRADRIAIAGNSSGGHLAALVGVTNGNKELEGKEGDFLDESSSVQAIVSYYGASDLMTLLKQSTPFGVNMREPALTLLLGDLPDKTPVLARLASPVVHVDRSSPPLYLLHGDQDPQMPINQSHELEGAYEKLKLDATFDVVYGAGHGGPAFFAPEHLVPVIAFLKRTIGQ